MTIPEAILSGFLQGVTEFLPISSSGHLVLLHGYFGLSEPQVLFDLFLHLGTLGAVLVYFSGTIIKLIRERRFSWLVYIAAGTVPAVGAALLFEDRITSFFAEPGKVAYMLIVTGVVLFAGQAALVFNLIIFLSLNALTISKYFLFLLIKTTSSSSLRDSIANGEF